MPKIIKVKTYMCSLGAGNLNNNPECRWHCAVDNLPKDSKCPVHHLNLVLTTDPNDQMTVTIMDEVKVDTLIKRGNETIDVVVADKLDQDETTKAQAESRPPVIPPRVALTVTEKNGLKAKIQADIIKFTAIESK